MTWLIETLCFYLIYIPVYLLVIFLGTVFWIIHQIMRWADA